jgi:plastocyanin
MIDELVGTGVPAVAASSSERRGGGAGMLLLYLLIPLIAVVSLVTNKDELAGGAETPPGTEQPEGGEGGGLAISAANVQFDTDQLAIPADGAALQFVNEDTAEHNVAIYEDESASKEIFKGTVIPGGQETTYEIPSHKPGEYYFQCDVHPAMNGTATFE